jgi:LCP family protein required for cell wall assembly
VVPRSSAAGLRRSWPQRIILGFSLSLAIGLVFASSRLTDFDEVIGSIVRIEVGAGVLAPAPTTPAQVSESGEVLVPVAADPIAPRNFLLIGTDSAIGLDADDPAAHRDHPEGFALADVIMLARVDPGMGRIHLISIPRDLYLPIYSEGVPLREEKLASSLMVGGLEQGAPTLVETISTNFNVPIHNFVVVDFYGFEQIVDLVGGVNMCFETAMRDPASQFFMTTAGCHTLDGPTALAYVRSRKMEAVVDGWWRRVGASNDMERNQRQQDFMILMLEKMVDQGISTLLTNTDLIETAAGMVVFDERITLGELMDLGQSFVDIEPDHVIQHVLPVTDGWAGEISVLKLTSESQVAFEVFRGETVNTQEVPVLLVDARGDSAAATVEGDLATLGFAVETVVGDLQDETTIRVAPEYFAQGVLVARYIEPTPRFIYVDDFGGTVELTLGADFAAYRWPPATLEEVETVARVGLGND